MNGLNSFECSYNAEAGRRTQGRVTSCPGLPQTEMAAQDAGLRRLKLVTFGHTAMSWSPYLRDS